MEYKFFCDENVTRKIQQTIEGFGYEVDSVRNQKLFGISNGDLVKHLNTNNFTLITFDKDFLEKRFTLGQGVIIINVHPNRDEFTIPLLKRFLIMLKNEEIDCIGKKIVLDQDFFLNL